MSDQADRADWEIENHLQTALANHKVGTHARQCRDGNTIICCECEVDIPKARLKVIPYANLCVDCATLSENRMGD